MKILLLYNQEDSLQEKMTLDIVQKLSLQANSLELISIQDYLSFKARINFDNFDILGFAVSDNSTNNNLIFDDMISLMRGPHILYPYFLYSSLDEIKINKKTLIKMRDINLCNIANLTNKYSNVPKNMFYLKLKQALTIFRYKSYSIGINKEGFDYCQVHPRIITNGLYKNNKYIQHLKKKKCVSCEICQHLLESSTYYQPEIITESNS